MESLQERILKNPLILSVFRSGYEVYLVGGFVRDILRGMESPDIDFIIKAETNEAVPRISSMIGGRTVQIGNKGLQRVIVDKTVLDFTRLEAALEDDLSRRDFTVNALAWSPKKGLIDPVRGSVDIERRVIRAISEKNLKDDPVRLLRAYRFSGELGWRIEKRSRYYIKTLKDLIKKSAPERITSELLKLLDSAHCQKALRHAHADGLLNAFISIDYAQLKNNLQALSKSSKFLKKLPEKYSFKLRNPVSQGISHAGLLRAEILLYRSNLEESRLRLSAAVQRRLMIVDLLIERYQGERPLNKARLFEFFFDAGRAIGDFALLTMNRRVLSEAERYMEMETLMNGEAIMETTGLGSGPEIARYLKATMKFQFMGRVKERERVIRWLLRMKNRPTSDKENLT